MTCAIWDSRHSSTTSGDAASSTHTAALRAGPARARLTSSPSARQAAWKEADHDDRQPEDGDLGDDLRPHTRHQPAGSAEADDHGLLQPDGQAPGGEDRVDEPSIDVPDDDLLDEHADQCEGQRREHEREPEAPTPLLDDDHAVGAEEEEFAMSHVDDV